MPADEEIIEWRQGVDLLIRQGATISVLPVEKWLADLERMDTIAPILDPTLYREYLYSGRAELFKKIFRIAIEYKSAIIEAREQVLAGKIK